MSCPGETVALGVCCAPMCTGVSTRQNKISEVCQATFPFDAGISPDSNDSCDAMAAGAICAPQGVGFAESWLSKGMSAKRFAVFPGERQATIVAQTLRQSESTVASRMYWSW